MGWHHRCRRAQDCDAPGSALHLDEETQMTTEPTIHLPDKGADRLMFWVIVVVAGLYAVAALGVIEFFVAVFK